MLSPMFIQSLPEPNLPLACKGILLLLYVDDISMLYVEDTTNAEIEVEARVLEKYRIPNLGLTAQYFSIDIHHDESGTNTAIGLGQMALITTILKPHNMRYTFNVSTPMDSNVQLDLAEDWGETELNDINSYQSIVGLLQYAALSTWPDISFAVNPHC
jgi:hypothetical protein